MSCKIFKLFTLTLSLPVSDYITSHECHMTLSCKSAPLHAYSSAAFGLYNAILWHGNEDTRIQLLSLACNLTAEIRTPH